MKANETVDHTATTERIEVWPEAAYSQASYRSVLSDIAVKADTLRNFLLDIEAANDEGNAKAKMSTDLQMARAMVALIGAMADGLAVPLVGSAATWATGEVIEPEAHHV